MLVPSSLRALVWLWQLLLPLNPDVSKYLDPKTPLISNAPLTTTLDQENFAVIFDAGSTGSRVHVFSFDQNLDLLHVGEQFEFFLATTPGLSSYEGDPEGAALSLKPLLQEAEAVVPNYLRSETPLRLGATAGLRLLPGNKSEAIIDAVVLPWSSSSVGCRVFCFCFQVRSFFKKESNLIYKAEWVTVLQGTDEGAYQWITINYLLGTLGKDYSSTIAVIDLGGGSVQMAYAISQKSAENAPLVPPGQDAYVVDKLAMGTQYHLYTHSYLNYGLKAARAQSLKLSGENGNPCVTNGYQGTYKYNGEVYKVSAPKSGTSLKKCRALTGKTLGLDAPCTYRNCSFDGVWNGGGGAGRENTYAASFFYDTAAGAGIIEENVASATIRPIEYRNAAKKACVANVDNIYSFFPLIDKRDVPFLCMDLMYEYTMLVDGYGVDPLQEITVVKEVNYKGSLLEAAWPLGCAVELLSSLN